MPDFSQLWEILRGKLEDDAHYFNNFSGAFRAKIPGNAEGERYPTGNYVVPYKVRQIAVFMRHTASEAGAAPVTRCIGNFDGLY